MKVLGLELEVPYWCSFTRYGSFNLKQSYPVPPPPTLFGLIQNALGKPTPHTIKDKNVKENFIEELKKAYAGLSFSIQITKRGYLIEDYINLLKGYRSKESEKTEGDLRKEIYKRLKKVDISDKQKNNILDMLKKPFLSRQEKNEITRIITNDMFQDLIELRNEFWAPFTPLQKYMHIKGTGVWQRTQVNKQKIIEPKYKVYIASKHKSGEYTLDAILKALSSPKRPLYLGESDDFVTITDISGPLDGIEDVSENISSIIPGIYEGCEIIHIVTDLRYNQDKESHRLCSIPKGTLAQKVDCINVLGENIVFL